MTSDNSRILAANLRRHRTASGLSQAVLAELAGLSRVGYRDIELGNSNPRPETLRRIAKALKVRLPELLTPVRTLSRVRFRSERTMMLRENILADLGRWVEDVEELEALGGHGCSAWTKRWSPLRRLAEGPPRPPKEVAQAVRQALGVDPYQHLVNDVIRIVEDEGIRVLTASFASESFFGLSVLPEKGGPTILVNTWDRLSVERCIFTVAQELGHLLMHAGSYDASLSEADEVEQNAADIFASHFLMPEVRFAQEWRRTRGIGSVDRVFKIKRLFRVSWRTVVGRVLEPLGPRERRDVWKSFSQGYAERVGRQLDESAPSFSEDFLAGRPAARAAEEPSRMMADDFREDRRCGLVRDAVESGSISVPRAAEILGLTIKEMRCLTRAWLQ